MGSTTSAKPEPEGGNLKLENLKQRASPVISHSPLDSDLKPISPLQPSSFQIHHF
jgi:hypothetical protein